VVIAIIGILATISVIALSNARAKSRDAKRAGDMKQVQTALELFFNDQNRYPTAEEWNTGQIYSTTTDSTTTYMQIIPTAPTPADGACLDRKNTFGYQQTDSGNSYTLSFCLGGNTGTLAAGPKCLTPGGIIDMDCTPFACGDQLNITIIGNHACNEGAPDYDQCTYDTVLIGNQCWLKENLNIGTIVTGVTTQTNNSILEKYCYNNNAINPNPLSNDGGCDTDGGLYQWNEMMQYSTTESIQGVCPNGWHIPSDAEQNTLDQFVHNTTCDANRSGYDCAPALDKLRTGGSSHFEGLFTGLRDISGVFGYRLAGAWFWSSTMSGADAWNRLLDGNPGIRRHLDFQTYGFPVRCLED